MGIRLTCFLLLIGCLPTTPLAAAMLFDNGGPLIGAASDVLSDVTFDLQTADDFVLPAGSGPLSHVRWYGVYDTAGAPPADDFVIEFYDDLAGSPAAAPLATFPSVFAARTGTGSLNPAFPIYQYDAILSPLGLTAGTPYWISIFNDTSSSSSNWYFSKSALAGDIHLQTPIGTGSWIAAPTPNEGDFAFALFSVPEPATIGLTVFAWLLLLCFFRGRRR